MKRSRPTTTEWITIILSVVFVAVYLTMPTEALATNHTTPLYTHLLYHFQHCNFVHLALNLYALHFLLTSLSRIANPLKLLAVAYLSASLASLPVTHLAVGSSGIAYALIGAYTYGHLGGRLRFLTPYHRTTSLISLAVMLAIGYIIPGLAGTVHLLSYLLGLLSAPLSIKAQPHRTLRSLLRPKR